MAHTPFSLIFLNTLVHISMRWFINCFKSAGQTVNDRDGHHTKKSAPSLREDAGTTFKVITPACSQ